MRNRGKLGLWIAGATLLLYLMQSTWPAGVPMPDLRWTYTARDLDRWLALLDPGARRWFALWHLTLDLLWPVLYGGVLWRWARGLSSPGTRTRWVSLLVGIPVVADFGENLFLALYAWTYPQAPAILARWASRATGLKWSSLGILLLGLGLGWLRRRLRRS